jgi:predicted metal-dependent enzyme (double-stranded beta helix superfamily)
MTQSNSHLPRPPVSAAAVLPCVARLHAALDAALELPADALGAALRAALANFADEGEIAALSAHCAPSLAHGLQRELLLADAEDRYSVVAIVWGSGQFSPIHGHHTWCAYRVLAGTLQESCFDWNDDTQRAHWRQETLQHPGALSYTDAGLGGIHRLGNPHAQRAISLHVYGIGADDVACRLNRLVEADAVRAPLPATV